jgi:hypothetical protein
MKEHHRMFPVSRFNSVPLDAIHVFYDGVREGIRMYAVYHDGAQYVGVLRQPLQEVMGRVDEEEQDTIAKLSEL